MTYRIDIVSDTHGNLSRELLTAIEGCDLLIHAGDITSDSNWATLRASVPQIRAVLGNNDWCYNYGPDVDRLNEFTFSGLRFAVAHYSRDLSFMTSDVAVCGHTHRAKIEQMGSCLVINPGSASYPRGGAGPTIGRLMVDDGMVLSAEIIEL